MGTFLKAGVTFNNPNLTKLSRDSSIDNNTVMLMDFGRTVSNPSQGNLPNGAVIPNSVVGGASASVVTAAGRSLMFSTDTKSLTKADPSYTDYIRLPDVCKVPEFANSLLFTMWFTHLDQADVTGSQALAGWASNSSTQMPFAVYWYNGVYNIGVAGRIITFPSPADGTVVQVAAACDRNLNIRRHYLNGEVVANNTDVVTSFAQPTTFPGIFYIGGAFNNRRNMLFHRAWMDINGSGNNFDAKVLADYNNNKTRF